MFESANHCKAIKIQTEPAVWSIECKQERIC
jgi:hypothetical protein